MADVFVSYKAEDRARVRPLVDALQADGLDVWWDAQIGAGQDWRESIAANLDKSRCVIVIWSKRSVGPDGRFVRDEAARAVKRGAYLPLTIDKVEPPLGFGETQCLPLAGWKGNRDDPRYLALLDAARHTQAGRPAPMRPAAVSNGDGVDRRLVLAGGTAAGVAAAGGLGWFFLRGSAANANSVAVMPFANLSGDPGQAYFSDGLAEELRSALARISGLKVIGRTSSEALRNDDTATAAKKLDVGSILTGSVRRSPSTIRVSAQLVDGGDGSEKWSQTFDRPNGDVLQIQTNIAEAVAEQLRSQLGAKDKAALTIGGTTNAAAQDLLLKADGNVQITREALQMQISLYDAAIALDPDYAAAHAGRSMAQTNLAGYLANSIADLNRGLAEAAASARKAISLAPDFSDGHYALALNRTNSVEFPAAWVEYQRALAAPGASPRAKLGVAGFVSRLGDFARANSIWQSAADSDPLNPRVTSTKASIAVAARRYDEAIPLYEKYLAQNPESTGVRGALAASLLFSGRNADAAREVEKLPHDFPTYFVARAVLARRAGDRARATSILNDMRKNSGDNGKYQYAEMLADMGDLDAAMTELAGSVKLRDPGLLLLPTDPLLDPLRNKPEFQMLVRQLNYPRI